MREKRLKEEWTKENVLKKEEKNKENEKPFIKI